jgi:hypothetical protein
MRAIYRRDGWVLGRCIKCGRYNYVEPHGRTARCACTKGQETEHANIPYAERNMAGTVHLVGRRRR